MTKIKKGDTVRVLPGTWDFMQEKKIFTLRPKEEVDGLVLKVITEHRGWVTLDLYFTIPESCCEKI